MSLDYPAPDAYTAVKYSPQFLADVLGGTSLRDWAARDRTFITAPREVLEVVQGLWAVGFPSLDWEGDAEITYRPAGRQSQFFVSKGPNKKV